MLRPAATEPGAAASLDLPRYLVKSQTPGFRVCSFVRTTEPIQNTVTSIKLRAVNLEKNKRS